MAKKILVVDDDVDVLSVLEIVLTDNGYTTILAHDGLDALEKVSSQKPDLIILDIMLPKLDGHSVNLKLKENPQTANIPVIIITAYGHLKKLIEIRDDIAISGYFEKPFETEELLETIKKLLKK